LARKDGIASKALLPWSGRIELDLRYIEHRSWRPDPEILRKTAHMVFHGAGLYKGALGGWDIG
jgi:lipopolysaccharide/colanic/teichoic acid biosynthesis glycosyltransferase